MEPLEWSLLLMANWNNFVRSTKHFSKILRAKDILKKACLALHEHHYTTVGGQVAQSSGGHTKLAFEGLIYIYNESILLSQMWYITITIDYFQKCNHFYLDVILTYNNTKDVYISVIYSGGYFIIRQDILSCDLMKSLKFDSLYSSRAAEMVIEIPKNYTHWFST